MSRARKLLLSAGLGAALALGSVTLASGEIIQAANLIINLHTKLTPTEKVKKGFAPVTFTFEADLSTRDGTLPPMAKHVEIDFNNAAKLTNLGLPVCQPGQIQDATVDQARAACSRAIVGTGHITVQVLMPGTTAPVPVTSDVTAFNGPSQGLDPTLLVHAYIDYPTPTAFVAPVVFSPIFAGRYRIQLDSDPPPIANGYGHVTHFDLTIGRRYKFAGRRFSVASVRCGLGGLVAAGTGSFVDGTLVSGLIYIPCRGPDAPRKGK